MWYSSRSSLLSRPLFIQYFAFKSKSIYVLHVVVTCMLFDFHAIQVSPSAILLLQILQYERYINSSHFPSSLLFVGRVTVTNRYLWFPKFLVYAQLVYAHLVASSCAYTRNFGDHRFLFVTVTLPTNNKEEGK